MQAFIRDTEIYRIALEDDQWIDIKTRLSFGEVEMMTETAAGREAVQKENTSIPLMLMGIVDWSFEEAGQKVPITEENLRCL